MSLVDMQASTDLVIYVKPVLSFESVAHDLWQGHRISLELQRIALDLERLRKVSTVDSISIPPDSPEAPRHKCRRYPTEPGVNYYHEPDLSHRSDIPSPGKSR